MVDTPHDDTSTEAPSLEEQAVSNERFMETKRRADQLVHEIEWQEAAAAREVFVDPI